MKLEENTENRVNKMVDTTNYIEQVESLNLKDKGNI